MRESSGGFSIIELVIAISLSSFVLVGVATIAAQMARRQIEGIRSGTMTGWSLVSYLSMSKEIEDANVLAWPIPDGSAVDAIVICKNWSRVVNGRLNTNTTPAGADSVTVIQYCVDSADPANLILRRFARSGTLVTCPTPVAAAASCGPVPSTPWGAWSQIGVVGLRLERLGGAKVFTRDNSVGGVRLRYVIGTQSALPPNPPIPKFTPFDIRIGMQKQYNNALD